MVQTKTQRVLEQPTKNLERTSEEHASWKSASDQVVALTYDSDFAGFCEQNNASPDDQTSYQYALALDGYVTEYATVHFGDGTLTKDEADRLKLIGGYPANSSKDALVSDWSTATLNNEDLSYYLDCKESLVNYNQLLSKYIYNHGQDLALTDIASAIVSATGQMSPGGIGELQHRLISVLRGARTEAINRNLVDRLEQMAPGAITGRRSTAQEDLAGVDYVVNFAGQPLYLDFKSSLCALLKGNKPSREELADGFKMRTSFKGGVTRNVAVMMPTFDEASLGDACALPAIQAGPAAMVLGNNLNKISKA